MGWTEMATLININCFTVLTVLESVAGLKCGTGCLLLNENKTRQNMECLDSTVCNGIKQLLVAFTIQSSLGLYNLIIAGRLPLCPWTRLIQ